MLPYAKIIIQLDVRPTTFKNSRDSLDNSSDEMWAEIRHILRKYEDKNNPQFQIGMEYVDLTPKK